MFSLDAPYFLPWSWSGADWLQYYCLGDGVEQTGFNITVLEMEWSRLAPVMELECSRQAPVLLACAGGGQRRTERAEGCSLLTSSRHSAYTHMSAGKYSGNIMRSNGN